MATAPAVPNFTQFNFVDGDTSAVITKQNGVNAALEAFGNQLGVMTDSINDDLETISGAYYGALDADPTEDPNGTPPGVGDRYFNTEEGVEKSFNGTAWQANEVGAHLAAPDPHPQYEFRVMHNTTATRAPNANDDSAAGYASRSTWFDTSQSPPEAYRCISAATGAAQWVKTSLTLDELGSAATANTGDFDPAGAATAAVAGHAAATDPHTQYEKKAALKAAAYRQVVGGDNAIFALGSSGESPRVTDDMNQSRVTGTYYSFAAAGSPAGNGHFFWSRFGAEGDFDKAIYIPQSTAQRAFIAGQHSGIFYPPVEIYTTGNLIGSVSLSSGLPSGSVFERGSNSFGKYVKRADGKLFCIQTVPVTLVNTSASYADWVFPYPFSSPPAISFLSPNSNYFPYTGDGNNTSARIGFRYYLATSVNVTLNAVVSADGFWYE